MWRAWPGHLAQFRLSRNLLVPATGDDKGQDVPLARRQGIEALLQLGHNLGFLSPDTIALLKARGYTIKMVNAQGEVAAIMSENGWLEGSADPRTEGTARGY